MKKEIDHLPIVGGRVYVTGTKHNGFRGVVVRHEGRVVIVQLDEFDEPVRLYNHNLLHEFMNQN